MADQHDVAALRGIALPSMCTLETSGQVASITGSWRRAASSTLVGTPCALKIVTAPAGISSSSSTKRALGL